MNCKRQIKMPISAFLFDAYDRKLCLLNNNYFDVFFISFIFNSFKYESSKMSVFISLIWRIK